MLQAVAGHAPHSISSENFAFSASSPIDIATNGRYDGYTLTDYRVRIAQKINVINGDNEMTQITITAEYDGKIIGTASNEDYDIAMGDLQDSLPFDVISDITNVRFYCLGEDGVLYCSRVTLSGGNSSWGL